jgi:tRNA(fMet)-specific endonuclease VapC
MRFLFDTDHASILQRPTEPACSRIDAHEGGLGPGDTACAIVSFHEQVLGAHALINRSRDARAVLRGYEWLGRILAFYSSRIVLPFDEAAAREYGRLASGRLRVATMDLRIASIALSRGLTLLTRNRRDFGKIPGLSTEDWTT